MERILAIALIFLFPLSGYCLSDQDVFNLLSGTSKKAELPLHVYVAPINKDKKWSYGAYDGTPLPVSSYQYFANTYGQLKNAEFPGEIFAIFQFSQGTRWQCFLLRVPGIYSSDQIDLWMFDTVKKQWMAPMKIAEAWGDGGEAIDVQGWIEDINKDGLFDVVRRTLEIDMHIYDDKPHTTKKIANKVFIWDKDHFKDASNEYSSRLKFNKYIFKKNSINSIH